MFADFLKVVQKLVRSLPVNRQVAMQESYHPKTSPRWVTPVFLK